MPTAKRNQLDAQTAFHNIQLNRLPTLGSTSYVRLIPLLLATVFGVISFGISLFLMPRNNKKCLQRRALLWLESFFCFISAALTCISFALTFHEYSNDIKNVCSLLSADYICSSYTPGLEIILLGLSVGLFTFSSVYCVIMAISLGAQLSVRSTLHTNNSHFSLYNVGSINHEATREKQTEDSVTIEESVWNNDGQRLSLHPPPSKRQSRCRSSSVNHSALKQDENHKFVQPTLVAMPVVGKNTSSAGQEDVLLPPTLPFAPRTNKSKQARPLSYDSANTFGALQSGPNSPTASMNSAATSYLEHPIRDSTTHHAIYATGGGSTQSNHTLGTFNLHESRTTGSEHYTSHNSSFEHDPNISNQSLNEINPIPDQPSTLDLHQRINEYRQHHVTE